MSQLGSLVPWFGSKRTMAPAIVEALGPHTAFWDIFTGSMAVLLAKEPCRCEVVNDLHGDLINLARVIQHPRLGPALYRRLRRVWFGQVEFAAAQMTVRGGGPDPGDEDPDPDLERAHAYFVAGWMGLNGTAGTATAGTGLARRFSSRGGDPGARWAGAVASIPAWRRRMARVQVLSTDGIELAARIEDRDGTVIYADPPYLEKGARYRHDFARRKPGEEHPLVREYGDHGALALALRRFRRTRVVVSYYADEGLEDLYPGWTVREVDMARAMANTGADAGARAPEVLLVNDHVAPRGLPSC